MGHLAERATLLIQSHIAALDNVAKFYEDKWGVGRLPLLVPPEEAARFHQQRQIVNAAVWDKRTVEDVKAACEAMQRAWAVLDGIATAAGYQPLLPQFWEAVTDDGTVVVIARDDPSAWVAQQQGRQAIVFTLAEIAHLLKGQTLLAEVKRKFPGAKVIDSRPRASDDPLPDDVIPF